MFQTQGSAQPIREPDPLVMDMLSGPWNHCLMPYRPWGGVNLQLLKRRPTGLGCNCELAILVLNILHCWLHQYLETWWVCKVVVLKNTAERGQISRPSVSCSPSTCRMPSKRNSNHWSGSKLPGYLDHLDPKACHISSIPDLGAQWTTWSRSSVNDWLAGKISTL